RADARLARGHRRRRPPARQAAANGWKPWRHSDSLTGPANRLRLRQRTEEAALVTPAPGDSGRHVALICLDVDHFKSINDTLGHAVGDAVLVEVARRLQACLRPNLAAARLGGDEFALVIDAALDDAQAQALARRLVRPWAALGGGWPDRASRRQCGRGGRAGPRATWMNCWPLQTWRVRRQEAGRGRYAFFSPRLGDRRRRRVLIGRELRGALAAR
ncbi:MAG: GGDEF domain-containing protein, partial [Betaproteobacteria bacterium]|nr:GGDEF domain-containing protein [Betaproteobacteria bacterium]